MTLTRPAYQVTVENLDNAFTQTVTAGDSFDPADGVWLADGLELTWNFEDTPPALLEPETATFAILADGIANLPTFEQGDRVTVSMVRPTAGTPITYMDFAGRITDRKLTTDAKSGRLLLELTATDPTSESTNYPVDNGLPNSTIVYSGWADLVGRPVNSRRWLYSASTPFPLPPIDDRFGLAVFHGGVSTVGEALPKTLYAGLNDTYGFPVHRYVAKAAGITAPGWRYQDPVSGDTPVWAFYMAQWLPQLVGSLPALFEYAYTAGQTDKVTAAPTTDPLDPDASSLTVLDACYLPDGANWVSDRSDAPNQITITGVDTVTGDVTAPVTRRSASAQARYGVITRTFDTWAIPANLDALAARYLALCPKASADAWQFGDTSIDTHLMDDATLDAYAPLFWTQREPTPGVMGRLLVLANVDPDIDPTGGYLLAHLAGATFTAEDGQLFITPQLVPALMPAITAGMTPGPSYDDFGASAFGDARYHDPGGTTDFIDHGISYEKAKLTTL